MPQNYVALELNEARINWFNAASNYNDVVTAAADEGTGQGFVTEFAGKSTALANVVWSAADEGQWQAARNGVYGGFDQIFQSIYNQWGQWDGFWDAIQAAVTLPANVKFADFRSCPNCYSARIQFAPSVLWDAIEKSVIKPVRDVQSSWPQRVRDATLHDHVGQGDDGRSAVHFQQRAARREQCAHRHPRYRVQLESYAIHCALAHRIAAGRGGARLRFPRWNVADRAEYTAFQPADSAARGYRSGSRARRPIG